MLILIRFKITLITLSDGMGFKQMEANSLNNIHEITFYFRNDKTRLFSIQYRIRSMIWNSMFSFPHIHCTCELIQFRVEPDQMHILLHTFFNFFISESNHFSTMLLSVFSRYYLPKKTKPFNFIDWFHACVLLMIIMNLFRPTVCQ